MLISVCAGHSELGARLTSDTHLEELLGKVFLLAVLSLTAC